MPDTNTYVIEYKNGDREKIPGVTSVYEGNDTEFVSFHIFDVNDDDLFYNVNKNSIRYYGKEKASRYITRYTRKKN